MSEEKTSAPAHALGVMKVERVHNVNKPTFYANNTIVMANQWDIQFVFSLVHETAPGQIGSVDEAMIIMTPEHALAFSKALQSSLESYAASQGGIRVVKPPDSPNS